MEAFDGVEGATPQGRPLQLYCHVYTWALRACALVARSGLESTDWPLAFRKDSDASCDSSRRTITGANEGRIEKEGLPPFGAPSHETRTLRTVEKLRHTKITLKAVESASPYLGSYLRLTHIAALNALEAAFAPYKMSPTRFALLTHTSQIPGLTQAALADWISADRTTLVPMLSSMVRSGLMVRRKSIDDKRSNTLWLTKKGEMLLRQLHRRAFEVDKRLCGKLSKRQRRAIIDSLIQLRRNISG
jgi:DNA-binding MarR family transcriptional regulator